MPDLFILVFKRADNTLVDRLEGFPVCPNVGEQVSLIDESRWVVTSRFFDFREGSFHFTLTVYLTVEPPD